MTQTLPTPFWLVRGDAPSVRRSSRRSALFTVRRRGIGGAILTWAVLTCHSNTRCATFQKYKSLRLQPAMSTPRQLIATSSVISRGSNYSHTLESHNDSPVNVSLDEIWADQWTRLHLPYIRTDKMQPWLTIGLVFRNQLSGQDQFLPVGGFPAMMSILVDLDNTSSAKTYTNWLQASRLGANGFSVNTIFFVMRACNAQFIFANRVVWPQKSSVPKSISLQSSFKLVYCNSARMVLSSTRKVVSPETGVEGNHGKHFLPLGWVLLLFPISKLPATA